MENIVNFEKQKKFFKILGELGRVCVPYYKDDCQKAVFVRRYLKRFHPYWKFVLDEPTGFYETSEGGWNAEEIKIPILKYVAIARIEYYLGHGEELQILYWDATSNKMGNMKLGWNDMLKLKGEPITVAEYLNIAKMFKVDGN